MSPIDTSDSQNSVDLMTDQLVDGLSAMEPKLSRDDCDCGTELTTLMDDCLHQLERTDCRGPANRVLSSRIWNRAESWLSRGEMQRHARIKPRGYAGDFELLDRIYRRHCSDDPWGRLFDQYFQSQHAPRAVRHRRMRLCSLLISVLHRSACPVEIASVGAGPATELLDLCRELPPAEHQRLAITLLDMDPAALEFASEQLRRCFNGSLTTERINLGRLTTHRRWSHIDNRFDFVYCAGLLDYLDDAAAVQLIRLFHQWLKPGGHTIVYNFDPFNPTRGYMEWIGNWYLIYRDLTTMRDLIERVRLSDTETAFSSVADGVLVEASLRRCDAV